MSILSCFIGCLIVFGVVVPFWILDDNNKERVERLKLNPLAIWAIIVLVMSIVTVIICICIDKSK